jgi:mannose/fructose/N-acetylgalactosamine-specific phosphotransferase system component IIB
MKMSIVLFRIDERLIHGQVVVGWGAQLRPDRIVVVDDAIAGSDWEQELYCLGMPPDVTAEFVSAEDARDRLDDWRGGAERVLVLAKDAGTMLALGRGGLLRGAEVNIGGLHHAPGRREVLPYVFLSPAEAAALRALESEGAEISARDLPNARRVPLAQLLRESDAA